MTRSPFHCCMLCSSLAHDACLLVVSFLPMAPGGSKHVCVGGPSRMEQRARGSDMTGIPAGSTNLKYRYNFPSRLEEDIRKHPKYMNQLLANVKRGPCLLQTHYSEMLTAECAIWCFQSALRKRGDLVAGEQLARSIEACDHSPLYQNVASKWPWSQRPLHYFNMTTSV